MAANVRFVGVPRPLLAAEVAELPGWRALGYRALERAKQLCPPKAQSGDESEREGPRLRETLEIRFIGGGDPRQLIGSATKGTILRFVLEGTDPHIIQPVQARALRFKSRGVTVFATLVQHPTGFNRGTVAAIIQKAIREIVGEARTI